MCEISRRFRIQINLGFSSLIFAVAFVLARPSTTVPRNVGRLTFGPLTSRKASSPSLFLSPSSSLGLGWVGLIGVGRVPLSHSD